jgi:hypothetical protein
MGAISEPVRWIKMRDTTKRVLPLNWEMRSRQEVIVLLDAYAGQYLIKLH